jgi:cellulose synthase/poly-beta-1,6-N-acetylglucosamine synthase-like glycosyltransferase
VRVLFAISAVLLGWAYGVYLVFLRALLLARPPRQAPEAPLELPAVTVLVFAFNEESTIAGKIENSLALDYPEDRLDVIVASDGSTDATNSIVAAHPSPRVRLLEFAERRGKGLLTNDVVAAAEGEWLLFTDAETRFEPDALLQMARHFRDPAVGMVDGELVCVNEDASSIAADVGLYWRLESALKAAESGLGCLSSTFGACSALRRSLFQPLLATEDIDFRTPLDLVAEGYLVVHEPRAQAAEVTHSGLREQFRARVRMVTKNLPGTLRRIDGRIARRPLVLLGIVSHKLLRWFTPYLLIANLLASLRLARRGGRHRLPLAAHAGLLGLGAAGAAGWRRGREVPVASSVFSFLVANAGFLVGVANSARGVQIAVYRPSQELASLSREADERAMSQTAP